MAVGEKVESASAIAVIVERRILMLALVVDDSSDNPLWGSVDVSASVVGMEAMKTAPGSVEEGNTENKDWEVVSKVLYQCEML